MPADAASASRQRNSRALRAGKRRGRHGLSVEGKPGEYEAGRGQRRNHFHHNAISWFCVILRSMQIKQMAQGQTYAPASECRGRDEHAMTGSGKIRLERSKVQMARAIRDAALAAGK